MGIYQSVYLGPYAECTHKNETEEVTVYGCTTPDCKHYKHHRSQWEGEADKFCPDCGSKKGASKLTRPKHIHPFDVVGDDLKSLVGQASDHYKNVLLGSNLINKHLPRAFHVGDGADWHVNVTALDREAERQWFADKYATQLEKLHAAYETVEIKWGLHVYYG